MLVNSRPLSSCRNLGHASVALKCSSGYGGWYIVFLHNNYDDGDEW